MTKTQKVFRFVAIFAALLAFSMATDAFLMLDQGEERHWAGFLISWAARIGTLGLAITIALSAIDPLRAFRFLWLSALAVSPLFTFLLIPSLWCAFLDCGPEPKEFIWEPVFLLHFAALATAIGGFYLSKPK